MQILTASFSTSFRLASSLVCYISPICAFLVPCQSKTGRESRGKNLHATARQILRFIAWSVPLYGVPSQTPEVTFSGGSSELPQTPFPVAGSIYGPSAMLRFLHPKRYQVLVDAPPASECRSEELSSSTSGDHEGLHPTSVRFRRYPLRGTVLATSLARWGDSVTGVNANYHLTNTLSTPNALAN